MRITNEDALSDARIKLLLRWNNSCVTRQPKVFRWESEGGWLYSSSKGDGKRIMIYVAVKTHSSQNLMVNWTEIGGLVLVLWGPQIWIWSVLWYHVKKCALILTQPHKTGSMRFAPTHILWKALISSWCGISNTLSRRDYQLVREDICYGWSDNSPMTGGLINPTNTR